VRGEYSKELLVMLVKSGGNIRRYYHRFGLHVGWCCVCKASESLRELWSQVVTYNFTVLNSS